MTELAATFVLESCCAGAFVGLLVGLRVGDRPELAFSRVLMQERLSPRSRAA